MLKYVSFIGVVVIAISTQAYKIPNESEFEINNQHESMKSVGSTYTYHSGTSRSGAQTNQFTLYYESFNSLSWEDAIQFCKKETSGSILQIETQAELNNVISYLDSGSFTNSYWVGGQYNAATAGFEWINQARFSTNPPWMEGQPNLFITDPKVEAYYTFGEIRYRTALKTDKKLFICEVQLEAIEEEKEQEPEPCNNDNQLVIIVDSSGSVGSKDFAIAKEFTAKLAEAWKNNSQSSLSVINYSTDYRVIISLKENLSLNNTLSRIRSASYIGGGTSTSLAMNQSLSQFKDTGNPRGIPRNVVVLTDGYSNLEATTTAANTLIKEGIHTFAVGITSSINQAELNAIAGGNSGRVFNVDKFHDLLRLLLPVSRKLCP